MPLLDAQVGDTVQYRNTRGETFNVMVRATQPAAPAGGAWSVANQATGGTLGAATYSYRIAQVKYGVIGAAATAKTNVVGSGTTNRSVITLPTDVGLNGVAYNIYGRTGGAELLLASNITAATWDDTGALTPAGALPTADGRIGVFTPTRGLPATAASSVLKATALRGAGSTNVYFKR
jgi:hypothetical protein